jgi:excinuclease ABC subunit B
MVVDESHVTLSQVHDVWRKRAEKRIWWNIVLTSSHDNVPKFEEFEAMQNQVIYVSATQLIMNFKKMRVCCRTSNSSYI